MSQDSSQERTEAPTPQRREEARRKGQVARSAEATSAIGMFGSALALWLSASLLGNYLTQVVRAELSTFRNLELTIPSATIYFANILLSATFAVAPLLAIAGVVTFLGAVAQSGLSVSFESLTLDWSRISPGKGWGKLFSLAAAMRGVIFGIKLLGLFGVVMAFTLAGFDSWVAIAHSGLLLSVTATWEVAVTASFVCAVFLGSIAAADYGYQWWQNEQRLKMTFQQLREDHREHDGDPKLKQKIRSMQREAAKLRMLQEVPTATVILTNPTHIAVAIRYDRTEMATPIVVAKGTDALAKRISAIAREHNVPVLERKPLARALYASVDINQEIPATLYKAIAEILAYVYGLKRSA